MLGYTGFAYAAPVGHNGFRFRWIMKKYECFLHGAHVKIPAQRGQTLPRLVAHLRRLFRVVVATSLPWKGWQYASPLSTSVPHSHSPFSNHPYCTQTQTHTFTHITYTLPHSSVYLLTYSYKKHVTLLRVSVSSSFAYPLIGLTIKNEF